MKGKREGGKGVLSLLLIFSSPLCRVKMLIIEKACQHYVDMAKKVDYQHPHPHHTHTHAKTKTNTNFNTR